MDPNYWFSAGSTKKSTGTGETKQQKRQRLFKKSCAQFPFAPPEFQLDTAKRLEKQEDDVSKELHQVTSVTLLSRFLPRSHRC